MTIQQVLWASQHDWFIESIIVRISGQIRIHVRDDMVAGNTLGFNDFEELKHWAGY